MFQFIWRSKWEKIGRSQLCCDVEAGGAKMIDLKQYLLALQFKWAINLFDKSYKPAWKLLEHCCCKENLFFVYCVQMLNLRTSSFLIKPIYVLLATLYTLTLKSILDVK